MTEIELTDIIKPKNSLSERAQGLADDFMKGARDDIINALSRLPSIEASYLSIKIFQCLDEWFDQDVFIRMLEENTSKTFDVLNEITLVDYEK